MKLEECRVHRFDVLVIGAGLAGLRAAVAAARSGARTAVLAKSPLGAETATCMAGGGFCFTSEEFPPEEYRREVFHAGRGLNDPALIDYLAEHGADEFRTWSTAFKWPLVVRDKYQTAVLPEAPAKIPGYLITRGLAGLCSDLGVVPFEGLTVLRLLVLDGRFHGCLAVDTEGGFHLFLAGAGVLASGGYSAIYKLHDNPPRMTGDGQLLALAEGAVLRDMEFVQFFPLGLNQPTVPRYTVSLPFPAGTRLIDDRGEDVLLRHYGPGVSLYKACKDYRDLTSILILKENRAGRKVFVDFSRTAEADWSRFTCTQILPSYGFNLHADLFQVSPIAHYTMGGVVAGPDLQTYGIIGLFAAGEVVGGVHGANRYAANSLTACVVHGRIAGENAAAGSGTGAGHGAPDGPSGGRLGDMEIRQWLEGCRWHGLGDCSKRTLRTLRDRLQKFNSRYLIPLRSRARLEEGARELGRLRDMVAGKRGPAIPAKIRDVMEIENTLILTGIVLTASLMREESRGAHFRDDFPEQDDERWRRPILVSRDPGGPVADTGDHLGTGWVDSLRLCYTPGPLPAGDPGGGLP